MKVRLLVDLTQYDEHLLAGVEGRADLDKISYTDWEEELVECKFPNAVPLPIAWRSLEILDKGFWKARERDIKQAIEIEFVEGPRGGFKWMRIYSKDRSGNERIYTTNIKHNALKLLAICEQYGKVVHKKVKR